MLSFKLHLRNCNLARKNARKYTWENREKKIHMGKYQDDYKCQDLYLDKWSEKDTKDSGTEEMRIEDVCGDTEVMEEVSSERYLGHIISNDGRNISNIKS